MAISGGRSAQDLAPALRVIGIETLLYIPLIAWIAIVCFVVFTFIMAKTPFGRHVTMIGGNPVATFRAGIKVDRLIIITFVLAGAIAGLAGWLLAIRTSGATANLGIGMLFHAFAAVVIGGVSLKGGIGQLPGVYAGVLLLSSIQTAINLMGLPAHYTQMILGGAGAGRRAARHGEARRSGRSSHDRTTRRTEARWSSARRAASAQASPSASSKKAPRSSSPIPKRSRQGHRAAPRRPLHRDRHIARKEDAERAVATAVERFGGLDILVQNAGIYPWTLIENIEPDEWDSVLAVNLKGTFLAARAALP